MTKRNDTAISLRDVSNYCKKRQFKCTVIFNREASKLILIAIHDYLFLSRTHNDSIQCCDKFYVSARIA